MPPPKSTVHHDPIDQETVETFIENDRSQSGNQPLLDKVQSFCLAVAYLFKNKYKCNTDENEWPDIEKAVREDLGLHRNTKVKFIFADIIECLDNGVTYDGKSSNFSNRGRKPVIACNSMEAQIVADCVQRGGGIKAAQFLVNDHRREEAIESVTRSAVEYCIKRLKPKVKCILYKKQGSTDETSKWCRARNGFSTQLAIQFQILDYEKYMELKGIPGPIPRWFDKRNLTIIGKYEVAFFDEVHRKVQPGSDSEGGLIATTTKGFCLIFPRDQDGKLDFENGTYCEEGGHQMQCKYIEEVRFCFGVTVDEDKDGELTGVRLPTFNYTSTTLTSVNDYNKLIADEINRVQNQKNGKPGGWVVHPEGTKGKIYLDDTPGKLKGIGKVTVKKLKANGINTVGDIIALMDNNISTINDIKNESLISFRSHATEVSEKIQRPEKIDYRKSENPYKARYGKEWKNYIAKAGYLKGHTPITSLIDHIVKVTKDAGKKYFYHDALSLMTANESIKYMKEIGALDMWIRPECGLFSAEHDPDLKAYEGRPVGNSPELMPLDNTLNKDIHECVNYHCVLTNDLDKNDKSRFGMGTTAKLASAYLRITDPSEDGVAPSSKRIVEDHNRVFDSILSIIEANGTVIEAFKCSAIAPIVRCVTDRSIAESYIFLNSVPTFPFISWVWATGRFISVEPTSIILQVKARGFARCRILHI